MHVDHPGKLQSKKAFKAAITKAQNSYFTLSYFLHHFLIIINSNYKRRSKSFFFLLHLHNH
ncbi:CLUMA_CG016809, isoform A [Clunio marinus]|uniref:CLUMA_CG016809, isoform A n=1 Tax=Clunio marinus TaxID=568069 RepID=A0A1J1IU17_9DIPT|nr:CLUMA_CG016809, isoform A [Clunio marinus]